MMNKCKCCGGDGFLESHDEDYGFVFSSCEPCNDSGYVSDIIEENHGESDFVPRS